MNEQLLVLCDVRFGFANRREFLGPVSLGVRAGECWAIVGPNGAGKSTLLRLMAGLARPTGGSILLASLQNHQSPLREQRNELSVVGAGDSDCEHRSSDSGVKRKPVACAPGSDGSGLRELSSISHRDRARVLAYVPQQLRVEGELTVREVVLLGRYPHRGAGYFESEHDERVAHRAMALTESTTFAERSIRTLSGGEAQRVHVAAALAQEPRVLLLDEPTASLDLKHQLGMFELLRGLAGREGIAVVVATHDLNLAAKYCTHVLLLNDGKVAATGTPEEVIRPDVLEPVYGVRMLALRESERSPSPLPSPQVGEGGSWDTKSAANIATNNCSEGGQLERWIVAIERVRGGNE